MENIETCRSALHFAVELLGLNTGASTLDKLQDLDDRLVHGRDTLEDAIKQLRLSQDSSKAELVVEIQQSYSRTQNTVDESRAEARSTKQATLQRHDKLEDMLKTAEDRRKVEQIVSSLDDERLHMRREGVTDAHERTFDWILNEDQSNFASWLSEGSGIYWIKGKAGSGKSTLMKYLVDHEHTEKLLREWAGCNELLLAEHFFWVAGTSLQKSNQGLLRGAITTNASFRYQASPYRL